MVHTRMPRPFVYGLAIEQPNKEAGHYSLRNYDLERFA